MVLTLRIAKMQRVPETAGKGKSHVWTNNTGWSGVAYFLAVARESQKPNSAIAGIDFPRERKIKAPPRLHM